jgi:hypothetical protein
VRGEQPRASFSSDARSRSGRRVHIACRATPDLAANQGPFTPSPPLRTRSPPLECGDGKCPDGFECVASRCEPIAAGEEAGSIDGSVDPIDAALPDAAFFTCDQQFGAAPGYQLCEEKEGNCSFLVLAAADTTCAQICADLHGTCVMAGNADPGAPCIAQTNELCDVLHTSQICTRSQ